MKTIGLTSPHTHGPEVGRAQQLLKHNWTHVDFLQGAVDNDFGPQSARGCVRAKFWLGYPRAELLPVAGPKLLALLADKTKLPASYKATRTRRLNDAKKKTPLREKALARAERDLGMKEHPRGSNICPISDRWGFAGPWCNMAVSIWYIDAGSKAFREHLDWAYVPFFLAAAEAGTHGVAIVRPELALPGDAVAFDWDNDGVADHVGLLRGKIATGAFRTIEGNTGIGNDSNGGEVMHRERGINDVVDHHGVKAFIRVGR